MPRQVLTDRGIKALRPARKGERRALMDAQVPGFGIRITDKADEDGKAAQRTFILVARYPGGKINKEGRTDPKRRALGEYDPHSAKRKRHSAAELPTATLLSLEEARDKARGWISLIASGVDPATEVHRLQERRHLAELAAQETSFAVVTEEYLKRHVSNQRRAGDVERVFRNELLPAWEEKPVAEISRRDVVKLVDAIVDRGATYQAHNVLGQVRTFFNWVINRGIYGLETSPCDRLKPTQLIGSRDPRQRILSDAEIAAVWRATERMSYPYGSMYRMLLLTGQRKSEVAEARWPEFDLDRALWTVPPERFKSNATHLVPLSKDAVALLKSLPTFERGDHLLSTSHGVNAVQSFAKAKDQLDALMVEELGAELLPWVTHDIRRTVRTKLSGLRVPEPIAEMVIGHARKGLARVYDQHQYLDEMREALELWAAKLRDIVSPPPENVVKLKARAS